MLGLVSIDGHISPIAEARIVADDRGLLFGDAICEIIAAVGPQMIDLLAHLERLRQAALTCHFDIEWSDEALKFELDHLLSLTRFTRSSLRLLITRGSGLSLSTEGKQTPHRYIYCTPSHLPNQTLIEQGLRLKIKRHPFSLKGPQIKSPHYLHAIIAQTEAQKEGYDEILWINQEGEITEGASSNIFLLSREGDLVEIATPPPTAGILPGITRGRVIELLHRSKIPVTERTISLEELPRFDEAFVTSSIRGLLPIQLIERHRLHSTRPQAVFHHISHLYKTWESHEAIPAEGEGSPIN